MGLIRTAAAALEPVSLAEAKSHLNVIDDAQDTLITLLIGAARKYAEAYCGRSFITQGWRLTLDAFPCVLQLERGPVQSVDSIIYADMAGATQTITAPASPDYAIDLTGPLGRVTPGFGRVWPIPLPQIGAVQVNYTAGYGDAAADVPEGIRHWMLVRINTAFENREEVAVLQRGTLAALPYVDYLLDEYRTVLA